MQTVFKAQKKQMGITMKNKPMVTVITVTLNRPSLFHACKSVDNQTYKNWHHYVIGDGVLPNELRNKKRSVFGFSRSYGKEEPGLNMPDGTPNPIQRWALNNLKLGDYFCFLDDDNVYDKKFIEKMVSKLQSDSEKGIVLCGVDDRRHLQDIMGRPEPGNCDNSGVMFCKKVADTIEFPHALINKNVTQDVEYIQLSAKKFDWCNIPEKLVIFGSAPNIPTIRGGIKLIESWEMPILAYRKMKAGDIDSAIKDFLNALELDSRDGWSLWRLAEAYAVQGQRFESKKLFRKWIALAEQTEISKHHYLSFCLGMAKEISGQNPNKFYNRAIKSIVPTNHNDKLSKEWYQIVANHKHTTIKYKQLLQKTDKTSEKYANAIWKAKVVNSMMPNRQNIIEIYKYLDGNAEI